MARRFHVLGIPHTVSHRDYSSCAFTAKVVKLCRLLKLQSHHVIHYGHADSDVACDEHVAVTTDAVLERAYPGHDWRAKGWPAFSVDDHAYAVFNANASHELAERKRPGDFLLCSFGHGHRAVADEHRDMIVVEPGIGYPDGMFAPFKVFESYAALHAYHGSQAIKTSRNDFWYDAVIPNYFDLADFTFSEKKGDYFLFLGRVSPAKGVHLACQIARELDTPLVVAGQGDLSLLTGYSHRYAGVVGPDERRALLAGAKALLCPSTFLEPFCGVQVEAMLSGTPVISSDWGAFAEVNRHGVTGYRCHTFEQFCWAARNAERLSARACRAWGERFSLEAVGPRFDEYWQMVADVRSGAGFYERRPARTTFDWLY